MRLEPALSAYLDLLRFIAAFSVLVGHMDQDGLSMGWMPLADFSHDAVVVFFVLSGFIIHHSTASRGSTWRQYVVARTSRIYSVALPAVVFSVGIALLLVQGAGTSTDGLSNFSPPSAWHAASSLLFLNESWWNPAELTMNIPYWSLCYEVWYYVLFGLFFFVRGSLRWPLLALGVLVAGPAILVLFPIWIAGAWLSASGRYRANWPCRLAWAAFLMPLGLLALVKWAAIDLLVLDELKQLVPAMWRLESSQRFLTDYLIGALLCLHIAAFSALPAGLKSAFARTQTFWASLAGFSFTLYLFHRPLTQLLGKAYPQPDSAVLITSAICLGIMLLCWLISWGTEKRLPAWRAVISEALVQRHLK